MRSATLLLARASSCAASTSLSQSFELFCAQSNLAFLALVSPAALAQVNGLGGRPYQGWSTYHFSPVTDVTVSFREVKASIVALPGGGTQSDAFTRFRWEVRPNLSMDAFVQYERWFIPVLKPGAQSDVTGQLQLTWHPHWEVNGN